MKKWTCRITPVDVLYAAGSLLLSVGVGLWACAAAGLVAGGVCCLVAAMAVDVSGKDGEDEP